eukprot:g2053.t1
MNMRSKFTAPGTSIYYYEVEWPTEKMSWADFRGKWSDLGLKAQPDTGDNGVHASASPFEALAERSNWLRASISKDSPWRRVEFEGGKKSLFDLLEDLDAPA